ncbi:MAG: hypothetical protein Q9166_007652 [cf. Caloplaca sp. 2 TL-2023]
MALSRQSGWVASVDERHLRTYLAFFVESLDDVTFQARLQTLDNVIIRVAAEDYVTSFVDMTILEPHLLIAAVETRLASEPGIPVIEHPSKQESIVAQRDPTPVVTSTAMGNENRDASMQADTEPVEEQLIDLQEPSIKNLTNCLQKSEHQLENCGTPRCDLFSEAGVRKARAVDKQGSSILGRFDGYCPWPSPFSGRAAGSDWGKGESD